MPIRIIEESDLNVWGENWKMFPSSIFLAAPWLESFRSSTRTPVYLRFVLEERTVGIAAGLRVEPAHPVLKKIHRLLYFFSGPAVIQAEQELTQTCIAELIHFAAIHKFTHLVTKYRDYPYVIHVENLPFKREISEEYMIDLSGEFSDIQKKMKRMVGKNVRKATRHGLTFHQSFSLESLDELFSLLDETKSVRLAKGYENYSCYYMPYLDKDVFVKLLQHRMARIFSVKKAGKTLCARIVITHAPRAYDLLIGTAPEGYELGSNAFSTFSIIKQLHAEGFTCFNFGGVPHDSSKSGAIFYKTSFGAEKHVCSGGMTPHLNGPLFDLLTNMYRKMPEKTLKHIITRFITGEN